MTDKARLVIGAGGTGGHMFPAAAFAEEMAKRGWDVGLISDDRGLRYAETLETGSQSRQPQSTPTLDLAEHLF